MLCLDNLSGPELVILSSILAISISENKSPDEIDTLGNFFSSLGANLSTIAGQPKGTDPNGFDH